MDESATIENVCQAIDALKSPNSEISSMSAKWLAEFQKTVRFTFFCIILCIL